MVCSRGAPLLVILEPDADRARRIELRRDYMVVGRTPGCDVRFDDSHVSREHAALARRGSTVYVEDLGSSGGTFVGGTAVTTARELHPGDVVTFATVRARFEPASTDDDTDVPGRMVAASPRFTREAFRREMAMTRTKALWLTWIGFLVFGEGLTIIAVTEVSLLGSGQGQPAFGPQVAGLPGEVLGWVLAAVGFLLLAAGLHIGAASSRRRAG